MGRSSLTFSTSSEDFSSLEWKRSKSHLISRVTDLGDWFRVADNPAVVCGPEAEVTLLPWRAKRNAVSRKLARADPPRCHAVEQPVSDHQRVKQHGPKMGEKR